MPSYEFYCRRCGDEFTAVMHVEEHERDVAECPKCHQKDEVEKHLSTFTPVTSHKSASV
jgi:putative FmdB family regulatory protein